MKTPAFSLSVNGLRFQNLAAARLVELRLTDKRAFEADALTLTFDDSDGLLALPPRGAKIHLALGWNDQEMNGPHNPLLTDKGSYIVDEISHTGPPDRILVRARSADFHAALNQQSRRSFNKTTLGAILERVSADHGLETAIPSALAAKAIQHIDQTDESDGHFLTRLGRRFDAIATIKAGRLVFLPLGEGKTAGGSRIPLRTIRRSDGDQHTFENKEGQSDYTGVLAHWLDLDAAETKTVTVKEAVGSGSSTETKLKTLRQTFASETEAQEAAQAEWQKIKRGRRTMQISLAEGIPDLIPETPVTLSGWKTEINALHWIAGDIEHSLNASGLTTGISLEEYPSDQKIQGPRHR